MVIFAAVVLIGLAGFVLFPAVTGMYASSRLPDGLWLIMAVWSVATAAMLLLVAALLWPGIDPGVRAGLLTGRHLAIAVAVLCATLVIYRLSGRSLGLLFALTVALVVVRAVLWLTTDLMFAHTFTETGLAVYGPLRAPTSLALAALVVTQAVLAALDRPWRSELARRALLFVMIPGLALSLMVLIPGTIGEYLQGLLLVPGLVAMQVISMILFRQEHRRINRLADREARLASFGTEVLAESRPVPELAAVSLIEEVFGAQGSYVERFAGSPRTPRVGPIVHPPVDGVSRVDVPIDVAGRQHGVLRVDLTDPTDDDVAFLLALGAVLSAALNRAKAEQSLRDQTLHDRLTGLPNWALLHDRLARLLADPENLPVGVLCCDIRSLKDVNADLGREAGDVVLQTIAQRLRKVGSPHGTVARIGADQFVLVEPCRTAAEVEALATRISDAASRPMKLHGDRVVIRVRVGFTMAESPQADPDRLVRDAEMAVMLAKESDVPMGAFSEQVRSQLVIRQSLIRALESAIEQRDIDVHYQPIVDLSTMTIHSVEALARWRTSTGESIPPAVFVRLAEEIGAIRELQQVVFDQAFTQLADWSDRYPWLADLRLSLNLAPAELVAADVADRVDRLLRIHAIDPARITLEVTESGLEEATETSAVHLAAIRDLGVYLSLDDFGTGYSTLARLMAFPVDELKIDRQFTISTHESAQVIVPAVVGMAHASGLTVVAEGIETEQQHHLVLTQGCDYGQGHLFATALLPADVPERVRRTQRPGREPDGR